MTALAAFSGLGYRYPASAEDALRQVDLEVGVGTTLLMGPSGGGKSTLLRCLNGLVPHFHGGLIWGRLSVLGLPLLSTSPAQLAVGCGFVFQDPERQLVYSTVEREVAFSLENTGMPVGQMRDRVDWALAAARAEHLRQRRTSHLSGGEKQRVAVAAAIATRPRILALDEPTSQLDEEAAAAIAALCAELAVGHAVVIAEHRAVAALRPGRVISLVDGTVRDGAEPPVAGGARPRRPAGRAGWSLRGVAVGLGAPLLEDVDLAGACGQVVALTGPNGAGKTTLLRCLAGLLPARSGQVIRPPGRVAYLPQDPSALLQRPTLLAEVELTLRATREPGDALHVIREVGLAGKEQRYPRDLSGGQRQRAAIACVIVGSPGLVLFDEPTRGMDADSRGRLVAACDRLAAGGAAIVIATHDRELVTAFADAVFEVRDGGVRAA